MVPYDQSTEDVIRTAHYVPAAERGGAEQPVVSAEEVLASLEDRQRDAVEMEAEDHARLGTVRTRHLEEEQLTVEHIEQELDELISTGLMNTEREGEFSLQDRLRQMRDALATHGLGGHQRRAQWEATNALVTDGHTPVIANQRGGDIADSNDPEFFPKTFPCLFPWGSGGPKNGPAEHDESNGEEGSGHRNFTLRTWARTVLQRHGKSKAPIA
jgi:hypothetical protein